jgi:sugar lactone lactonase YvrE
MIGSNPYGIFVDASNTIYVSNHKNHSIQAWSEQNKNPTRTISNIAYPGSIFVSTNGKIYFGNNKNIHETTWSLNGTNSIIILHLNESCFGIFVDINDTLYCSIKNYHLVVTKLLNDNEQSVKTVAGNGVLGTQSHMLNNPHGIFVDINFNLYVADCGNHRIQKFRLDTQNAITEAVIGKSEKIVLNCPTGVVLDANDYLFIVDSNNNRIVGSGPDGFRCIVGCSRKSGSQNDQLNKPLTMTFDSLGNIFVADTNNSRIQKFLVENNKCGK